MIALLVSGGLDSYVALHYAARAGMDVRCVYVDLGHPYAHREKAALGDLGVEHVELVVDGMLASKWYEGIAGDIIAGRNLLLATLAAGFGDRVWLCALDGEMHPYANRDKSHEWFHATSGALSYSFFPVRPQTIVETPFGHLTKTEVVALALELDLSVDALRTTSSCYVGHGKPCGECGTCFKRWIAMSSNGIEEVHETQPWRSQFAADEYSRCAAAWEADDFSHYSAKRCIETLDAMRNV